MLRMETGTTAIAARSPCYLMMTEPYLTKVWPKSYLKSAKNGVGYHEPYEQGKAFIK